ncbi:CDP-diacylglycerol--serine O-phosphatidyltransferase [Solitalea longa]|uniref:CDP-diacylglycerol--serine O-phosphatidyltransferase n=1 Tax=Solitalea longa TaxID=2079460 RepID=A0A2S5A0C1_9SPHI|nr:CDP-alcohol phosphatidyltransferase family protein [Solitalea longa]POY36040.1 CDP-diacylglycerol--serine O-phosphatidyltransferase [Solitalea longa]
MKKHIPNFITCLNLFCGCIAAVYAIEAKEISDLKIVTYLMLLAAFFDFIDGFAARLLKAPSAIGKDLDSLADMVSFGFVPGTILFSILKHSLLPDYQYWAYSGYIVTVFSALRLAKFNNDDRQTDMFIGVPTPINALFIGSLTFIFDSYPIIKWALQYPPYFIFLLIIVQSYLLVSELPLIALKFKSFDWQSNKLRYILIISSVVFIILFKFAAVPLILFVYILLSLVQYKLSL